MAVSNTDDHLRNHGFILTQTGWRLSPLYDVNPVPYGEDLALNVSEDESAISFDLAIETAQYYGITQTEAEKIVEEISTTVRDNWERLASEYGLSRGSIEKMRPAFSACY
jgi:serine/threonine-protein kinase HipA